MLYESQRIINKNKKYVKTMAYYAVNKALNLGLSYEEIKAMNEIALKDNYLNETQVQIFKTICKIAQFNMENKNEETIINRDHLTNSNLRI